MIIWRASDGRVCEPIGELFVNKLLDALTMRSIRALTVLHQSCSQIDSHFLLTEQTLCASNGSLPQLWGLRVADAQSAQCSTCAALTPLLALSPSLPFSPFSTPVLSYDTNDEIVIIISTHRWYENQLLSHNWRRVAAHRSWHALDVEWAYTEPTLSRHPTCYAKHRWLHTSGRIQCNIICKAKQIHQSMKFLIKSVSLSYVSQVLDTDLKLLIKQIDCTLESRLSLTLIRCDSQMTPFFSRHRLCGTKSVFYWRIDCSLSSHLSLKTCLLFQT